jgi:hypothetical protein
VPKDYLVHVTKLRKSSGIIKPQLTWYLATEKEITTLVVWGTHDLFGRKGNLLRPSDPEKVYKGYPRIPSDFVTSVKLMQDKSKAEARKYEVLRRDIHRRSMDKSYY